MAENKIQIDWSNFAVGVGAFAATGAVGYAVSGIVSKPLKIDSYKLMLAALPPALGAGIIAYFLRKDCPPCICQPGETRVTGTLPMREGLIGYGAVPMSTTVVISSTAEFKNMLNELGYNAGSGDETDEQFSNALSQFQRDWGFPETGQLNPDVQWGIEQAYLAQLEEDKDKKKKWAWIGLGLAGAAGVVGTIYFSAKAQKKRKKRSR